MYERRKNFDTCYLQLQDPAWSGLETLGPPIQGTNPVVILYCISYTESFQSQMTDRSKKVYRFLGFRSYPFICSGPLVNIIITTYLFDVPDDEDTLYKNYINKYSYTHHHTHLVLWSCLLGLHTRIHTYIHIYIRNTYTYSYNVIGSIGHSPV